MLISRIFGQYVAAGAYTQLGIDETFLGLGLLAFQESVIQHVDL